MGKPVMIETPSGEKLVLLALADYQALLAEAEEDAADAAAFDDAMARLASGEDRVLSPDEMIDFRSRPGFLSGIRKARDAT